MNALGNDYILRRSVCWDAWSMMQDVRQADLDEWAKSLKGGLQGHLWDSVLLSDEAWTVMDDRDRSCHLMYGVVGVGKGCPAITWMVATNRAQMDALWLCARLRPYYTEFFKQWPLTECFSAPENIVHHRWLQWLGYHHARTLSWGAYGHNFFHFKRDTRQHV